MKCNNIGIKEIAEGEEKELGIENLFEKMTENFPNLERGKAMHIQEAQRIQIKMNPMRTTLRYIIIKMSNVKDKDRIIKAVREKQEIQGSSDKVTS